MRISVLVDVRGGMQMALRKILVYGLFFSLLIAIFFIGQQTVDASKQVTTGLLDLREEKIADIGPVHLNGDWDYFPELNMSAEAILAQQANPEKFNTGDYQDDLEQWRNKTASTGTYYVEIRIHPEDIGKTFALFVPVYGQEYDVILDDTVLLANENIDFVVEKFAPKKYQEYVAFQPEKATFHLILHIHRLNETTMEQVQSISLGKKEQIVLLKGTDLLFQIFVASSIFVIGFYHFIIFIYRRQEKAALYLAFACFGLVLRSFFIQETLLIHLFMPISWDTVIKAEFISGLFALLCFSLFIKNVISFPKFNKITIGFITCILGYILFIFASPPILFMKLFFIYQLLALCILLSVAIITIHGVIQKQESALFNSIGLFVLFISVWNDVLYYSETIPTNAFISMGLLVYLSIMTIYLAKKSSRSFDKVEKLSFELYALNVSLERKVVERTEKLAVVNDNLRRLETSRKRLFARVSHELHTPITYIQGYVKAMMDGVIPSDDSSYLRAVYKDTQMMSHMIADLQELSQLESGQIHFRMERHNILGFIEEIYEEQKITLTKANIKNDFITCFDKAIPLPIYCKIDPVRIKQVMNNLIVNALKHMEEKPSVIFTLQTTFIDDTAYANISVTDTGLGIRKKDLPYIFERFYKASELTEKSKQGSGLGLAICREIIDYHGGTIEVQSEKGVGSTFTFTLPLIEKGNNHEESNCINH